MHRIHPDPSSHKLFLGGPERASSPEKPDGKPKISAPKNGTPIPHGFKFPGKESADSASERREKAKSRSFWRFGQGNGVNECKCIGLELTGPLSSFLR